MALLLELIHNPAGGELFESSTTDSHYVLFSSFLYRTKVVHFNIL